MVSYAQLGPPTYALGRNRTRPAERRNGGEEKGAREYEDRSRNYPSERIANCNNEMQCAAKMMDMFE